MKTLLLLLAVAVCIDAYAQEETQNKQEATQSDALDRKHEVKIGAVKLLAGVILEGTYEYINNENFTFGASILHNFEENSDYPEDFSITPFARFYFQEHKQYGANGFFVEAFAKYVNGHKFEDIYWLDMQRENRVEFDAGAIGLALGKKWTNRTGFVFEILLGAGRTIGGSDNAPDAVFRGDFNLGYRF